MREVEIFFHQDFDMYGTGMSDTCFYHPEHSGIIHYKKKRYVMAEVRREKGSCGDLKQFGIYRENPEYDIQNASLNSNPIAQGDVQSIISIEVEIESENSEKICYWINTGKNIEEVQELNEEAEEYMHWTCNNSLETGLLPEQVDPFTSEGKSVALTWSHTTFIETALMYAQKKGEIHG